MTGAITVVSRPRMYRFSVKMKQSANSRLQNMICFVMTRVAPPSARGERPPPCGAGHNIHSGRCLFVRGDNARFLCSYTLRKGEKCDEWLPSRFTGEPHRRKYQSDSGNDACNHMKHPTAKYSRSQSRTNRRLKGKPQGRRHLRSSLSVHFGDGLISTASITMPGPCAMDFTSPNFRAK